MLQINKKINSLAIDNFSCGTHFSDFGVEKNKYFNHQTEAKIIISTEEVLDILLGYINVQTAVDA